MNVLPELDRQSRQSDFIRRANSTNISTDDPKQTDLYRRVMGYQPPPEVNIASAAPIQTLPSQRARLGFVIVAGALLGFIIWYFWDDITNVFQRPAVPSIATTTSSPDTSTQPLAPTDPPEESSFANIAAQRLQREPTIYTTTQSHYLDYSIEILRRGLTYEGKFLEGFSSMQGRKELLQITNQINLTDAQFIIETRTSQGQPMTRSPIWYQEEGQQPRLTDSGFAQGSILIPYGANSIILKESQGEILDQIYVPATQPQLKLDPITLNLNSTSTFNLTGTLTPPGQTYVLDVILFNPATWHTWPLIENHQQVSTQFSLPIDLSKAKLPLTSRWEIRVTARTFFHVTTVQSNTVTITVP